MRFLFAFEFRLKYAVAIFVLVAVILAGKAWLSTVENRLMTAS